MSLSVKFMGRRLRHNWSGLVLAGLLPTAFSLRTYGLDWDQGLFFHPDERQILMVVERLSWPDNLHALLTPESPLNPHFFAYGSFPLYLLRLLSAILASWHIEWASLARFYLLGRLISAFFDTLTCAITYLLARKIYNQQVAALATTFLTFTVLHIQLAHFYTVDTVLTAFVLLTVNKAIDVARNGRLSDGALLGILLGAALATKMSALPLIVVVLIAWVASVWPRRLNQAHIALQWKMVWQQAKGGISLTLGLAMLCFVLLEPYAIIDVYRFVQGVAQEVAMSQGWVDFPYTRQYAGTLPYLYQIKQILLFAMGPPLGLLGLSSFLWLCFRLWRKPFREEMVLLSWPLLYASMQGAAYAKFIRYMLPLLPFLCLSGAIAWVTVWQAVGTFADARTAKRVSKCLLIILLCVILLSTVFYALAFLNVYKQPHPWLQASAWLCQHLSKGSVVLTEYWDDPLPARRCPQEYVLFQLDLYAADTEAKLEQLLNGIEASDYIVLSSQRLYAPIVRLAARYPLSSRYYQQLFAERLGFKLVAAPAVYPQLAGVTFLDNPRAGLPLAIPCLLAKNRPCGIVLDLGQADESFTVYDHPQPLIFAKVLHLPRQELQRLLGLK